MLSLSPKTFAAFLTGLLVTSILGNITLITPGMLSWLGPWAPFVYGTTATILATLASKYKTDPLREAGKTAAQSAGTLPGPVDVPVDPTLPAVPAVPTTATVPAPAVAPIPQA